MGSSTSTDKLENAKLGLIIALPCFNSSFKALETIKAIHDALSSTTRDWKILAIDDGSVDDTAIAIKRGQDKYGPNRVEFIQHRKNRGLGFSIKEAVNHSDCDYFMWLPGDNDVSVHAIKSMFSSIDQADMCTIYRINRNDRGILRTLVSDILNMLHMLCFREFLLYVTSPGIYRYSLLKKLRLKSNRFGICAEINTLMYLTSRVVAQIPFHAQTGDSGSSALKIRNILEMMWSFINLSISCIKLRRRDKAPPRHISIS